MATLYGSGINVRSKSGIAYLRGTKFNTDQAKLLELYSSADYLSALRDQWQRMVEHIELAKHTNTLPI